MPLNIVYIITNEKSRGVVLELSLAVVSSPCVKLFDGAFLASTGQALLKFLIVNCSLFALWMALLHEVLWVLIVIWVLNPELELAEKCSDAFLASYSLACWRVWDFKLEQVVKVLLPLTIRHV